MQGIHDVGEAVIEACRGVALAYADGELFRAETRFSRVASVAEAFLAQEGMRARRLEPSFEGPWAVANAVAGVVCVGPRGATAREAASAARAFTAAMHRTASRS